MLHIKIFKDNYLDGFLGLYIILIVDYFNTKAKIFSGEIAERANCNSRLQFGMHCENKHLIKNNTISHYVQLCEKNF